MESCRVGFSLPDSRGRQDEASTLQRRNGLLVILAESQGVSRRPGSRAIASPNRVGSGRVNARRRPVNAAEGKIRPSTQTRRDRSCRGLRIGATQLTTGAEAEGMWFLGEPGRRDPMRGPGGSARPAWRGARSRRPWRPLPAIQPLRQQLGHEAARFARRASRSPARPRCPRPGSLDPGGQAGRPDA